MALPIIVGMAIVGAVTSTATYAGLHGVEKGADFIKNRRKKAKSAAKKPRIKSRKKRVKSHRPKVVAESPAPIRKRQAAPKVEAVQMAAAPEASAE